MSVDAGSWSPSKGGSTVLTVNPPLPPLPVVKAGKNTKKKKRSLWRVSYYLLHRIFFIE